MLIGWFEGKQNVMVCLCVERQTAAHPLCLDWSFQIESVSRSNWQPGGSGRLQRCDHGREGELVCKQPKCGQAIISAPVKPEVSSVLRTI